MKRLVAVLILLTLSISIPVGVNAVTPPPRRAQGQNQALVMSSLNQTVPMGAYSYNLIYYLTKAGYNVTYLTDGAVTVDFLLNNMNKYSVVIWRTNTFTWVHTTYWYVGEKVNDGVEQKYASDFAQGSINDKSGIVGISLGFFINHIGPNSLSGIKLLIFMSSYGNDVASQFITAGVTSVIYCNNVISLQFGLIDDLTVQMVAYLTQGQNVNTAVTNTISPFNQGSNPQDNLDTTYAPPFWYAGDETVTIA